MVIMCITYKIGNVYTVEYTVVDNGSTTVKGV